MYQTLGSLGFTSVFEVGVSFTGFHLPCLTEMVNNNMVPKNRVENSPFSTVDGNQEKTQKSEIHCRENAWFSEWLVFFSKGVDTV